MIAYIHGSLSYKAPTQVIVEVGGVGYELQISLHTYEFLSEQTVYKVFTYTHITQDAHTLYGFASIEEKQCFLQLLSVNGIGPRGAITILSSLTPAALQEAIKLNNAPILQAIKGIGPKAAQRIILELKGKIGKEGGLPYDHPSGREMVYEETLIALQRLGIQKSTAEKLLATVLKEHPGEMTVEALIKLALKG
eukprot:gene224-298_t